MPLTHWLIRKVFLTIYIFDDYIQYVKNCSRPTREISLDQKPIIGRRITFNPEEIGDFGLEQFFYILYIYLKFSNFIFFTLEFSKSVQPSLRKTRPTEKGSAE